MRPRLFIGLKSPRSTAIANRNLGAGVPVALLVTTKDSRVFAVENDWDNGFAQPAMSAVSGLPTGVTAASSQELPSPAKGSVREKMGLGGFL